MLLSSRNRGSEEDGNLKKSRRDRVLPLWEKIRQDKRAQKQKTRSIRLPDLRLRLKKQRHNSVVAETASVRKRLEAKTMLHSRS